MKKTINLFALSVVLSLLFAFVIKPHLSQDNNPYFSKGLDLTGMDLTVSPRQNFYLYMNGNWVKNTKIPVGESSCSTLSKLSNDTQNNLKEILETLVKKNNILNGSIERRVRDFYASGMDSVAIEKLGYQPIKPILAEVDAIKDYKDLLNWASKHPTEGGNTFLGIGIAVDPKNPTANIVEMRQAGLGLLEKEYYTKMDSTSVNIREAYKNYVAKLLILTGTPISIANQNAANMLALETKLAKTHLSRLQLRNPLLQHNKFSINDFSARVPEIDLPNVLKNLHLTSDTILVAHPRYFQLLNRLLVSEPIELWKTKVRVAIISEMGAYLSSPFAKANTEFNERMLNGTKTQQQRWKTMVSMTDHFLGDLLGQLYVENHFTRASQKKANELVENIKVAFAKSINNLEWMSQATKLEAQKKLSQTISKIAFPHKWKNYDGVEIKRDDYFGNQKALSRQNWENEVAKLHKPVDRTEWHLSSYAVNAYYNPQRNEIAFPAGMLQLPFFDATKDDAFNYGAIGTLIGHEMTHIVDESGRQYDYTGRLNNWWNENDTRLYRKRVQTIIDQYNVYTVLDGLHVNGVSTLCENMADYGGLSIAYNAFKMTKEGKSSEKIDGFTPDQRFFMAYSQIWRTKIQDEALRLKVNNDPHSPNEFRTNGPLSNFEPFYKAFGVELGDKMYRVDDQRTRMW